MSITIHFFRNRSLERIDYEKLIDYFDSMETCHINYYEDVVEMVYTDPVFDFPYRFLITKRSRVSSLYRLNRDYTNLHFLCDVPSVLPQYISRLILLIQEYVFRRCKRWQSIFYVV